MKKAVFAQGAPAAIGPYSHGVAIGDLFFTSGQIALVPETGKLVDGGIQEQTEQVLRNLEMVLSANGMTFANVVKTTVFIKEMNDFAAINEVYAKFFPSPFPSRSCVEVARLPKDVMLEIEAIAVK